MIYLDDIFRFIYMEFLKKIFKNSHSNKQANRKQQQNRNASNK